MDHPELKNILIKNISFLEVYYLVEMGFTKAQFGTQNVWCIPEKIKTIHLSENVYALHYEGECVILEIIPKRPIFNFKALDILFPNIIKNQIAKLKKLKNNLKKSKRINEVDTLYDIYTKLKDLDEKNLFFGTKGDILSNEYIITIPLQDKKELYSDLIELLRKYIEKIIESNTLTQDLKSWEEWIYSINYLPDEEYIKPLRKNFLLYIRMILRVIPTTTPIIAKTDVLHNGVVMINSIFKNLEQQRLYLVSEMLKATQEILDKNNNSNNNNNNSNNTNNDNNNNNNNNSEMNCTHQETNKKRKLE